MTIPEFVKFADTAHCYRLSTYGTVVIVRTKLQYPDGDIIDVCLEEEPGGAILVSDLGETMRWAYRQAMDGGDTAGKGALFAEVRREYGLKWFRGDLYTRVQAGQELDDAVERVALGARRLGAGWFAAAPAPRAPSVAARSSRKSGQSGVALVPAPRSPVRRPSSAAAAASARPAGRKKAVAGA